MNQRLKILFICSRNRRRSLTAETIFQGEPAWDVRSAGTEDAARIKVTAGQLGWADVIVVMEKRHKERLQQKFPEEFAAKQCICFFIADEYAYMDPGLIGLLREKMTERFPPAE
ncbi:MAG TPA: protein tyrosine phosphatase [Verrucomicrobiae bacterium]|nr:protein tyrosine phosphatase [Verrucomicrobiae bacterium]